MADLDAVSQHLSASTWRDLQARLQRSRFRRRFRLNQRDSAYLAERSWSTLHSHARDFIDHRLAPAQPRKDGRQTPMRGHPVFVAQHATATCCRGCLARWHGLEQGRPLDDDEREYVAAVVLAWLGCEPGQDGANTA